MKTTVALLTLLQLVIGSPPWTDNDGLTVQTTSGYVHGKLNGDVRQFLGIPFAEPPTGDLRFAPPQALGTPSSEVIEATAYPPSCMQWLGTPPSVYNRDVLEFNLQGLNETGNISEDCLTAAVWAPKEVKGPLPVLIFVYGGGFTTGGIDVPYQIPTQLVQRKQDVIVVSFNYRVNIFGFPNAAGLESQNFGLLDQRLAVEWTRDNIAAFGGDNSRMVLWGQSAGASSVSYYVYSYSEDPIISGFITDSGTARDATTTTPFTTNFTYVASQLGCSDPSEELSCMRGLPADQINNFLANYSNAQAQPPLTFRPVPDDKNVPVNITARTLNHQLPNIPGIIGTNSQDGVPFVPFGPDELNKTLTEQARLSRFFCPSNYQISLRQRAGTRPTRTGTAATSPISVPDLGSERSTPENCL
ncbi:Lipase 1 [Cyphellophora attinorum]|uniref:Carboxylic ester hydrolase n=1 Tax=Cyphellophora attinorum TaxID=1664694 RepID=A0A0N1H6X0_9EURO|nr:Lipase 1 [Phialophora attinorum]KPI38176.1 Lipase 1 [Phialophora attinorum]